MKRRVCKCKWRHACDLIKYNISWSSIPKHTFHGKGQHPVSKNREMLNIGLCLKVVTFVNVCDSATIHPNANAATKNIKCFLFIVMAFTQNILYIVYVLYYEASIEIQGNKRKI